VQVRVAYQHASGERRLRVATAATFWADASSPPRSLGFDAATAAVVVARWAAFEADQQLDPAPVATWLDRTLVAMARRYLSYTPDAPDSVSMPPEFAPFPEFVFHLRRSCFLDVFGNAPDETVYYRLLLFRCAARLLPVRPCRVPSV
jgi:protein transport protein SEC23